MGRIVVGILVAVGVAFGGSAWAHSQRKPAQVVCGPKRATTLAQDRVARVYVNQRGAYGCVRGGRTSKLAPYYQVDLAAVGGAVIAYEWVDRPLHLGDTPSPSRLIVVRLTDGQKLGSFNPMITCNSPPNARAASGVDSVVVKGDGAVAWIGSCGWLGRIYTAQVIRAKRGSEEVLDQNPPAIKLKSLELNGSRLTWKRGNGTTGRARVS